MTENEQREIYRYLGYHGETPTDEVQQSVAECAEEIGRVARPKSVFREFSLALPIEGVVRIDTLSVISRNLARNLKGCSCVFLMAATLGVEVDRLIARASAVRMSQALVYQAAAAARIEAYCDEINDVLREEARTQGLYCRPRFSPGYGDFDIKHQQDIVRLLDTPRQIGLTVTDSLLLAPVKSVTAVIGLSSEPQPCHKNGCEECGKKNCEYRR